MGLKFNYVHHDFIFGNVVSFNFNNKILDYTINKIKKDKMYFNLILEKDKIEPIETIVSMIKNKKVINPSINYLDKEGNNIFSIILNGFTFTKINLTDFKGYEDDVKKIKVKFKYSKIEYINHIDKLQIRKNKLSKLLDIKNISLNKDEFF